MPLIKRIPIPQLVIPGLNGTFRRGFVDVIRDRQGTRLEVFSHPNRKLPQLILQGETWDELATFLEQVIETVVGAEVRCISS